MPSEYEQFLTALRESVREGKFHAAVLWGALASALVAIVEYNLSAQSGHTIQISWAMLVAGIVAGVLYVGPRNGAAKAGLYAGAIPVLVLGPLVVLFTTAGEPVVGPAGPIDLLWVLGIGWFGTLAVLLVAGFCGAVGALAAHVTHWAVEALLGERRRPADNPA